MSAPQRAFVAVHPDLPNPPCQPLVFAPEEGADAMVATLRGEGWEITEYEKVEDE